MVVKLSKPLYHGTSYGSAILIYMRGFNSPIYLTEDKEIARHYARAATAYIRDKPEIPSWMSERYSIFTFHTIKDADRLVVDEYSPQETGQWIYKGKLRGKTYYKREDFEFKATKGELIRLQCFAIGMWSR